MDCGRNKQAHYSMKKKKKEMITRIMIIIIRIDIIRCSGVIMLMAQLSQGCISLLDNGWRSPEPSLLSPLDITIKVPLHQCQGGAGERDGDPPLLVTPEDNDKS